MTVFLTQREAASVLRLSTRTIDDFVSVALALNSSAPVVAASVTGNPTSKNGSLGELFDQQVKRWGLCKLTEVISYDYKVSLVKN